MAVPGASTLFPTTSHARSGRIVLGLLMLVAVVTAWVVADASVDCGEVGPCDGDDYRGAFLGSLYLSLLVLPAAAAVLISGLAAQGTREPLRWISWITCCCGLVLSVLVQSFLFVLIVADGAFSPLGTFIVVAALVTVPGYAYLTAAIVDRHVRLRSAQRKLPPDQRPLPNQARVAYIAGAAAVAGVGLTLTTGFVGFALSVFGIAACLGFLRYRKVRLSTPDPG